MTPEREAYLAKCNAKERRLRDLIQSGKSAVKRLKGYLRTSTDYPRTIQFIILRSLKTELSVFRHELQRLKGMDRVVIPSEQYDRRFETYNWYCTKCDSKISVFENYCSTCGRRILWEKG